MERAREASAAARAHRGNVVARKGIRRVRDEQGAFADSAIADDDHLQVHHEREWERERERERVGKRAECFAKRSACARPQLEITSQATQKRLQIRY